MPRKSRYVLVVDNLSSSTRSKDIRKEMEYYGAVRDIERDSRARCALVEFERSKDADYAWTKMEGFRLDGRTWKVDYATREDFKFFGWKWFEGTPERDARSRSRSPFGGNTPKGADGKQAQSRSPSPMRDNDD